MRIFRFGLVAAVLIPALVSAAPPDVGLSADAGVVLPTGPDVFDELWRPGVGIGIGAEYPLNGVTSLWGRVDYARFSLDEGKANGSFYTQGPPAGVSGGALTIMGFEAGVRLRSETGVVRPYLDLGAGLRRIDAADIQVSYDYWQTGERMTYPVAMQAETKPAFGAGLGVLYAPWPGLAVFADAHIDVMLTSDETTHFVPIRIGMLYR